MYPRLSDLFRDLFGLELPFPIYSFGFMVAVAVMTAAWLGQRRLDELYAAGRIGPVRIPAPKASGKGSREKGDRKSGSRRGMIDASPSMLMGTVTVIAVVGGFAGAKLFHILENLDVFYRSPGRMIFSTGGFTFYGGLIVGSLAIAWYVRRKKLSVPLFADALAPGLMLAYGIGRIGCHLSGDGDWGIPADMAAKPGWLPDWLWAETYPNNILGVDLSAAPVLPTPLYEFLAAALLFAALYALRNHPYKSGWLFWVYMMFNGTERFLIEKIRVNNRMSFFGIDTTQAEVIAVVIFLAGLVGAIYLWKRRDDAALPSGSPPNKSAADPGGAATPADSVPGA